MFWIKIDECTLNFWRNHEWTSHCARAREARNLKKLRNDCLHIRSLRRRREKKLKRKYDSVEHKHLFVINLCVCIALCGCVCISWSREVKKTKTKINNMWTFSKWWKNEEHAAAWNRLLLSPISGRIRKMNHVHLFVFDFSIIFIMLRLHRWEISVQAYALALIPRCESL